MWGAKAPGREAEVTISAFRFLEAWTQMVIFTKQTQKSFVFNGQFLRKAKEMPISPKSDARMVVANVRGARLTTEAKT